jgi:hypothetical protein
MNLHIKTDHQHFPELTSEAVLEDAPQILPLLDPVKALRELEDDLIRHLPSPDLAAMMNPMLSGVLPDAPNGISSHAIKRFRQPSHSELDPPHGPFRRGDDALAQLKAAGGSSDLSESAWMILTAAADDLIAAPKPWALQDVRWALADPPLVGAACGPTPRRRGGTAGCARLPSSSIPFRVAPTIPFVHSAMRLHSPRSAAGSWKRLSEPCAHKEQSCLSAR